MTFSWTFAVILSHRVVTLSQNTRGLPTEMAQSRMEHTNALLGQWKDSEKERRDELKKLEQKKAYYEQEIEKTKKNKKQI